MSADPSLRLHKLPAIVAWIVVMAVASGACESPKGPTSRPQQTKRSAKKLIESTQAKWCNGGLLCEDREPLFGYRVPWVCSHREQSTYLARCSMRHLEWSHVVEFFSSRYKDVVVGDKTIRIVGRRSVAAATQVTPTRAQARPQPPSLLVQRFANAIEVTVMRGAVD